MMHVSYKIRLAVAHSCMIEERIEWSGHSPEDPVQVPTAGSASFAPPSPIECLFEATLPTYVIPDHRPIPKSHRLNAGMLAQADWPHHVFIELRPLAPHRDSHVPREPAACSRHDVLAERELRKLERGEKMKFSHSIQFNAVPEWSHHYISYSNLKKL